VRRGVELPDPLLPSLPVFDLTTPIFALIYGSLLLAIWHLARHPGRLLAGVEAYVLMILMRAGTLWLVPLEPPRGMIALPDPVVQLLLPHAAPPPTRDLFFSGHVATAFLLFLIVQQPWLKGAMLAATLLIAAFLALQHVHYTLDLIAGPFFALGSYRAVLCLQPKGRSTS